jgi:hypothetical protein
MVPIAGNDSGHVSPRSFMTSTVSHLLRLSVHFSRVINIDFVVSRLTQVMCRYQSRESATVTKVGVESLTRRVTRRLDMNKWYFGTIEGGKGR